MGRILIWAQQLLQNHQFHTPGNIKNFQLEFVVLQIFHMKFFKAKLLSESFPERSIKKNTISPYYRKERKLIFRFWPIHIIIFTSFFLSADNKTFLNHNVLLLRPHTQAHTQIANNHNEIENFGRVLLRVNTETCYESQNFFEIYSYRTQKHIKISINLKL